MPGEQTIAAGRFRRLRVDATEPKPWGATLRVWGALAAMVVGFVIVGVSGLEPTDREALLGLASSEPAGPLGQAFGGWEPSLWPLAVLPSRLWAFGFESVPNIASIRWPGAIAGILVGLGLARRASKTFGGSIAGLALGAAWFGSLALIDRSDRLGVDLVLCLPIVAALDRLIVQGPGVWFGVWTATAFLTGGWPAAAIVLLAAIVLPRPESATASERGRTAWRTVSPIAFAFVGWSIWMFSVARAEVWAASLALPLTKQPDWTLAFSVFALGLPWTPLSALVVCRSIRDGWKESERVFVFSWLKAVGVCLAAGTLVPGLSSAARVPAFAGLAIVAGAVAARLWQARSLSKAADRAAIGVSLTVGLISAAILTPGSIFLAASIAYYRPSMIALALLSVATFLGVTIGAILGNRRAALTGLFAVALSLKLAHAGFVAPEWNYRFGQGPWGRAVGQWIPPRQPIYSNLRWPATFAFATGHKFRVLESPWHLKHFKRADGLPLHVLLLEAEFEHWPSSAPKLYKVRSFHDERGQVRILARTEGKVLTLSGPIDE